MDFGPVALISVTASLLIAAHLALRWTTAAPLVMALYHAILAVAYAATTVDETTSDAFRYYHHPSESWGVGSEGLFFLVPRLAGWLGASFLDITLLFSLAGFVGVVSFVATGRDILDRFTEKPGMLFWIPWFLPGLHFWSSGIGKDALIMLALGLLAFGASRRSWLLVILALVATICVRPYLLVFVMIALVAAYALARISPVKRLAVMVAGLAGFVYAFAYSAEYMGLETLDRESVSANIDVRAAENAAGGGAVAVGSSYPVKVFTYLFRPLFYDAGDLVSFGASLENVLLLALACLLSVRLLPNARGRFPLGVLNRFGVAFAVLGVAVLSYAMSNIGIALRQKYMFIPFLILALHEVSARRRVHADLDIEASGGRTRGARNVAAI